MFEILILTLILLMKIPNHEYVFLFNEKITVHCSFSLDSDEETGERPKPSNREVRYGAPTLRFLHSNYIYANLPLSEFTAQARVREASCPTQAQIFRVAAILPLLLKQDGAWTVHNYVL